MRAPSRRTSRRLPARQARTGIVSARRLVDAVSRPGGTRPCPRSPAALAPGPPAGRAVAGRSATAGRSSRGSTVAPSSLAWQSMSAAVGGSSRPHEPPLPRSDTAEHRAARPGRARSTPAGLPNQLQPASSTSEQLVRRRPQVEQPAVGAQALGTGPPRPTAPRRRARRQATRQPPEAVEVHLTGHRQQVQPLGCDRCVCVLRHLLPPRCASLVR
jgi:hypothetical protein